MFSLAPSAPSTLTRSSVAAAPAATGRATTALRPAPHRPR
jgi:hypothetical protein